MKVNNPNKIKDHFTLLSESHKDLIFSMCDRQGVEYNDISERFKYPVQVILITRGLRKFLTFGWDDGGFKNISCTKSFILE